jgi:hypothetical protein
MKLIIPEEYRWNIAFRVIRKAAFSFSLSSGLWAACTQQPGDALHCFSSSCQAQSAAYIFRKRKKAKNLLLASSCLVSYTY